MNIISDYQYDLTNHIVHELRYFTSDRTSAYGTSLSHAYRSMFHISKCLYEDVALLSAQTLNFMQMLLSAYKIHALYECEFFGPIEEKSSFFAERQGPGFIQCLERYNKRRKGIFLFICF